MVVEGPLLLEMGVVGDDGPVAIDRDVVGSPEDECTVVVDRSGVL